MLLVLFVGEIVGALWLYQNPAEFRKLVEEKLSDLIRNKYEDDAVIRESFDLLQQKYKCCGVDGYHSWSKTAMNAKKLAAGVNYEVPLSCCSDPGSNLCETTRNLGVGGLVVSSLSGTIYTEVNQLSHFLIKNNWHDVHSSIDLDIYVKQIQVESSFIEDEEGRFNN